METPHAIIWRNTAGESLEGPIVTTILVFDIPAGYHDHSDTMPLIQVIVLAVIQGITEFLPVSSTAHLIVAPWLLGWPDPGLTFDVALHVGTLVAVAAYFFRTWLQIILHGFGIQYGDDEMLRQNPRLLWLLVAGTIPAGVIGFLFEKQAESTLRSPFLVGAMMILIGMVMWIGERVGSRQRDLGAISVADSLVIGAAQALAVVPGVSRSGITITAGLFRNLDRVAAARFSFLLATPIIAGAAVKKLYDVLKHGGGIPVEMHTPFALGIVVSGLTGLAVIAFFLRFLQRRSLNFFIYYRIVFGIIVIALAASRPPAG
jgi:undecaprenyl-diphosphatase